MATTKKLDSSWEPIEKWYRGSVGEEGHYYHQHLILPGALRLLQLSDKSSMLELACGPGVLARHLPFNLEYVGVDLSPSLIKSARQADKNPRHQYLVADAVEPLPLEKEKFSHCAVILAIQNIEFPKKLLENAAVHLNANGVLLIVMNHPCFRIPRQSSWKIDEEQKVQYRRIDRYSSQINVPIQAHPSKGGKSEATWSFHAPLAAYSQWLYEAGFLIELIEEWHSDKTSSGRTAKMENRARSEIPLFLAIKARRKGT
jgi:SAM-dependent methyltransferase